jgi:hypothetical protein
LSESRDWQIDFGPAFGAAGTTRVLTNTPQVTFRGEKVMATDSAVPPGTGTRIMQLLVGQRIQRPTSNGSTTSQFFAPFALGNGVRWDTCEKALTIAITVSFVQACTFDLVCFGKCIVGFAALCGVGMGVA